jgi:hypothetical protein
MLLVGSCGERKRTEDSMVIQNVATARFAVEVPANDSRYSMVG